MDVSALYAMLGIRPSPPPAPVYRWTTEIMALPTEILVSCFQLACDADAEEDANLKSNMLAAAPRPCHLPRAVALTHVCSRWRTIALDTPRLWSKTQITVRRVSPFSEGQRRFLEMWASRSQAVALDVHVVLSCEFEAAHEDEDALSVLQAIGQLAMQHKSASLPASDLMSRSAIIPDAEPMLESGLDIAASIAQETYSLYYMDAKDHETRTKSSLSPHANDNDDWDKQTSLYAVRVEGLRQHARPDGVGLPGLIRDRYGALQTSLTTLNLRGGAGGRQTQTLSAEDLLILLRDFQRLRHVQAHVTHQHDNQRLHVPGTPPALPHAPLAHHDPQMQNDGAELAEHVDNHHHNQLQQQQQQQPQHHHPDPEFDDEIVTAPHLQHLDLSWDAVANAGLALRALHAPALAQLALRRRGASPFWLGHWEHLLHFLSHSGAPPLQALVLKNLDCTTMHLGACVSLCAGSLEGLALDACVFDDSEMRGLREGVSRCGQFKMLSVVDCPGITKGWCDGMEKVMMRRGVETNIRMLEPKMMIKAPGMW
ncbi:hypothetical protein SCHPADRAFT_289227 [Schizopora paradoxa]|uniref:Uncharacterized protein n=1 Tax=Schizopora paradoxa TaxID=27342 RepID=A0A0H2SD30_9AGAM|nr:hypothetical protein SCHPADRAFT_289227 [Schizopora paradoxa]